MLTLWLFREPKPGGRWALRLVPRPDGSPAPHDAAEKIQSGLRVEEYQSICAAAAEQISREHNIPIRHVRPSLVVLAELHADLRWPRKRRNADLRAWGYDIDGKDGSAYRRHFLRAMSRGAVREMLHESPAPPGLVAELSKLLDDFVV